MKRFFVKTNGYNAVIFVDKNGAAHTRSTALKRATTLQIT